MRRALILLLTCTALANAASAEAKPPGDQDAAAIAARIIRLRALDIASSGNTELALQLESLAHGVLDGRISLAEAALVMQISNAPMRAQVPLTAQAKSATRAAETLLDGEGAAAPSTAANGAPARPPAGAPLSAMPGADTPVSATTMVSGTGAAPGASTLMPGLNSPNPDPAASGKLSGKVYAVDPGTGTQVIAVALSITASQGAKPGQRYVISRGITTIAEARLSKVTDHMSYGEIVKGSLRDANNDVREGDQAVLEP